MHTARAPCQGYRGHALLAGSQIVLVLAQDVAEGPGFETPEKVVKALVLPAVSFPLLQAMAAQPSTGFQESIC